jgi:hypothetical protein
MYQHLPSQNTPKIYPTWDFWFVNIPSGNPDFDFFFQLFFVQEKKGDFFVFESNVESSGVKLKGKRYAGLRAG